jgi:uncharacterized membrane protein
VIGVRRAIPALVLLLFALPALAAEEGWPALFDVAGVAADDVLNIRAEPSAAAEIVGALAHDATEVEVVEADAGQAWGRVNTAEGSGWASLAYLARRPGQPYDAFPAITSCYGTEPFWSLRTAGATLTFEWPGEAVLTLDVTGRLAGTGRRDRYALTAAAPDTTLTAVLMAAQCNDGMSNRIYGLAVEAVLSGGASQGLWSGCCTLAP